MKTHFFAGLFLLNACLCSLSGGNARASDEDLAVDASDRANYQRCLEDEVASYGCSATYLGYLGGSRDEQEDTMKKYRACMREARANAYKACESMK